MKKFFEWLWWSFSASANDKFDLLEARYIRLHHENARLEHDVGHSEECCKKPHYQ